MRALPGSVVALTLLVPLGARAEDYSQGRCSGYAAQYDAAPSQDNIGKLMSAASCHEKGGRLADALAAWKRVEGEAADPDTKKTAQENAGRLDAKAPSITLVPRREVAAVPTVTIDGKPAAVPGTTRVNAGRHEIKASDGKSLDHASLDGETFEVLVPFDAPADGAVAPDSPPSPPPPSGLFRGGIIALAIGGVGVLGFAITGGLSLAADAELDDLCGPERDACMDRRQDAEDVASRGSALNIANAVFLGVGIVGLAVGIPMLVVGRPRSRGVSLSVPVPVATPTFGGVAWGGSF